MRRALALMLLLGGCTPMPRPAATPPPPQACVDAAAIPDEPPMVGQKFNGDAKHDLQVLAPNAKALRDWGEKLQMLLQGCLPQQPAPEATPAASDKKSS